MSQFFSGCLFRDLADGTVLSISDLQDRVLNDSDFSRQVALLPLGLCYPDINKDYRDIFTNSVINELYVEVSCIPLLI